jgi:chemotaxis protein MotB
MAGHGGAWKVAFADFMTAMMALFLVLWISAQDEQVLKATSEYFQNPFNSPMQATSGVMPFNNEKNEAGQGDDSGSNDEAAADKQIQMTFLNSVAADFYRLLHLDENLADRPIDIQVTSDGLRLTLFDRANQPLFEDNTAEFTEWGRFVIQNIAWLIDRHRMRVTIDGHTRAELALPRPEYGVWELSSDRANASRRGLVHYAVDPELIERVAGYADTRGLPDIPANDESNQRITLSLTLASRSRFKDSSSVETFRVTATTP